MRALSPALWLAALLSLSAGGSHAYAGASVDLRLSPVAVPAGPGHAIDVQAYAALGSADPSSPLLDGPSSGPGGGVPLDGERRGERTHLAPSDQDWNAATSGWHGLADLGTVPARPPPA